MGIHRGPNPVNDGLVFGYDTGYGVADNDTATRFYAGRNTINYLSSGVSNYNVVQDAAWSGATPTFTLGTSEFGTPIGTYTVGSTSYMYSYDQVLDDDLSTLSGQTVTWSVYLKRQGTSGNVGIRIYDNVSGYSTVYAAATLEFQRFSITKTLGANPTRIFVMIDNTGGGIIDFHSPQLEIGSDPSPFVDGTRSSTSSLIDLKRTTSIDVSNVSFDSTGQPTWDGTDDEINTGITTQLTDFSCVVIFKDGGSAVWGRLVDKQYTTGFFISSYFATGGNNYVGAGVIEPSPPHGQSMLYDDTKYNYFVLTRSGATHTIYLNGSTNKVQKTNGNSSALSSTEMAIGAWNGSTNSQRYTGEIPVVKLYNKELTAAEIEQDFKAYKNRFDI
jgi:hypothetical protein